MGDIRYYFAFGLDNFFVPPQKRVEVSIAAEGVQRNGTCSPYEVIQRFLTHTDISELVLEGGTESWARLDAQEPGKSNFEDFCELIRGSSHDLKTLKIEQLDNDRMAKLFRALPLTLEQLEITHFLSDDDGTTLSNIFAYFPFLRELSIAGSLTGPVTRLPWTFAVHLEQKILQYRMLKTLSVASIELDDPDTAWSLVISGMHGTKIQHNWVRLRTRIDHGCSAAASRNIVVNPRRRHPRNRRLRQMIGANKTCDQTVCQLDSPDKCKEAATAIAEAQKIHKLSEITLWYYGSD